MINVYVSAYREWALEQLLKEDSKRAIDLKQFDESFELEMVMQSLQTVSMFDDQRIVFLALSEITKKQEADVCKLLAMNVSDVTLAIWIEKLPAKSTKTRKLIDANATLYQDKGQDLVALRNAVEARCTVFGKTMDPKTLTHLVERLQTNPYHYHHALDACLLIDGALTIQKIDALIPATGEENALEISNALLSGNLKRALIASRQFFKGQTDPLSLTGLIGSQLRTYYQVSSLKERGYQAAHIASSLDISEKYVYFVQKQHSKSSHKYAHLLSLIAQLDIDLKRGKQDPELGFESFLIQVALNQ